MTENDKQPEIKDIERRLSQVLKYNVNKPIDMLENINEGFMQVRLHHTTPLIKQLKYIILIV